MDNDGDNDAWTNFNFLINEIYFFENGSSSF
jgi:hypothetical protein